MARLKNALRATITSKEFLDLREFHTVTSVLNDSTFWKWLFVMCRALYAPMQVLRLADQKNPAMDKLFYYVSQTDRMLPKYLGDVEERSASLMSDRRAHSRRPPKTSGKCMDELKKRYNDENGNCD
jgi:hypothetical protein